MFGRGKNYMEKETTCTINKKMIMSNKDIKEHHKMVDKLEKKTQGLKKSNKYNYIKGIQITDPDSGNRVYDFQGTRLPSVTTVLSATKNQAFLTRWKNKVGAHEAERIKNLSSKRGTAMHKFLESHIQGIGYDDLTPIGCQAKPMAQKVIEKGFKSVEEYYGSEVMLYYPGLYAGSTDLICLHDDLETVVDFKQANNPKKKEWIEDYFIQVAAYAMAHDEVYKSTIRQAVIMICTPDLYYQEFKIQDQNLRSYKHKWLKRLDMYHELKFDEKEQVQVNVKADEFKKNER
jgi:genome maintenance exonuclease 1